MANGWQCYFKGVPKQITVGDSLNLFCDGDTPLKLKEPIKIEFLDESYNYSLVVLETLKKEDYFLALKTTPYKTGSFKQSFYITDGENKLQIDNLSFKVQSVLTKKLAKPYGPYGPFKLNPDLLYTVSFTLSILVLSVFSSMFIYRFIKRRSFIQAILKRPAHLKPSKSFVVSLRKEQKNLLQSAKHLETSFKLFLENCLFIPVIEKSNNQIMKSLKNYHPNLYKHEGLNIRQVLNELSAVNKEIDKKSYFELKQLCQKLVFLIEETKGAK